MLESSKTVFSGKHFITFSKAAFISDNFNAANVSGTYRIYDLAEEQLFKNQQIKEKQYQTNIMLLKKLSEKALLDKTDADNKIVTAEALLEQGHLDQINFEYQLLNAELIGNTYKEVRFRHIAALLSGY